MGNYMIYSMKKHNNTSVAGNLFFNNGLGRRDGGVTATRGFGDGDT